MSQLELKRARLQSLARILSGQGKLTVMFGNTPCTDLKNITLRLIDGEIVQGVIATKPESWLAMKAATAHESAHIRFTDKKVWGMAVRHSRIMAHLVNIIEDARIERCISNLYPGTLVWFRFLNDYIFLNRKDWGTGPTALMGGLISYAVVGRLPVNIAKQEDVAELVYKCAPHIDKGRFAPDTKTVYDCAQEVFNIVRDFLDSYTPPPISSEVGTSNPEKAPDGELDPRRKPSLSKKEHLIQKPGKPYKTEEPDIAEPGEYETDSESEPQSLEIEEEGDFVEEYGKDDTAQDESPSNTEQARDDISEDYPDDDPKEDSEPSENSGDKHHEVLIKADQNGNPEDSSEEDNPGNDEYHDDTNSFTEDEPDDSGDDFKEDTTDDDFSDDDHHDGMDSFSEDETDVPVDNFEEDNPDVGPGDDKYHDDFDDFPEDEPEDLLEADGYNPGDEDGYDNSRQAADKNLETTADPYRDNSDSTPEDSIDMDEYTELIEEAEAEISSIESSSSREEKINSRTTVPDIDEHEINDKLSKGIHDGCKFILIKDFRPDDYIRISYELIYSKVKNHINKTVNEIRRILEYRATLTERNLRKGKLHGNSLWKLHAKDPRVFSKVTEPNDIPELSIYLLVDCSGSMRGINMDRAVKAACLLYETCTALKIPVNITGFTGTIHSLHDVTHYRVISFDDGHEQKYNIAHLEAQAENRDGYSIRVATQELQLRNEKQKVLIVLSDGIPAMPYRGYRGAVGVNDTALAVREAEKQGIGVIGLYFGPSIYLPQAQKIYNNCIYISDVAVLPLVIGRVLKKVISSL